MDKAELIKHEIEKRRDHNLAIGNPLFSIMAEEDIELLSFIDSLQEPPVNKVWHDASEKPREGSWVCVNRNGELTISIFLYDDGKLHNDYIDNELENCKWAYPHDLINVDNICNFGKNLQEEPVSEDLEKALASEWKAYNDRGAATVDALEDNTQELAFAKGFYRGSNWQRNQDQSTIELAEDHAMLAGRTKTIDEMKEALLSEVLPCFMHGGEADEVVAKLDEVLNQKK